MEHCNTLSALPITMNSREIADLVKSNHADVRRSIERLAERGVIQLPPTAKVQDKQSFSPNNKTMVYVFDHAHKRDSFIVVAQLSPEFTARLVDRWQELEAAAAAPAPVELSRMQLIELALSAEQERLALEQHVKVIQAKADAFDRLVTSTAGSVNLTNAAKSLQMRPRELSKRLNSMHWIYKRAGGNSWVAYQDRLEEGVLEQKITVIPKPDGTKEIREQVLVTAQGLGLLAKTIKPQINRNRT
ncbi:phage antirepressor KilAC domain-containing protein [Chromatium okenii]|jgi:phage regulator Rha-like protein|uniref:DNA-binding protein n=1 Tax=Chromatium okenii TaxID=61644 RepID=A0A2S7XM34_9GAMM|nr:phage antirepressor KilAC domain-containing protein [Chromatium okenii]MBV5311386.1 phage antirepressor KilAC domain-containing protein [Chromatium okenii]PQJ94795.1 DNA-binding protein [Chromatium okenii]